MPNRNAITIYASGLGNAYFENCTIINGISTGFYKVSSPSVVYFKNTIFGKTVGGAGNNCLINASEVVSQGYNIARDNSCGFLNPVLGDLSNTDALISVPASNGGPTMTSAISSTSPARDAVPLGSCSLTTDQRGNARPNGSACDIGAYEY